MQSDLTSTRLQWETRYDGIVAKVRNFDDKMLQRAHHETRSTSDGGDQAYMSKVIAKEHNDTGQIEARNVFIKRAKEL